MEYRVSVETDKEAYPALTRVDRLVETRLIAALMQSSLAALEGKLRYVPIVMPEGARERYPARSKLRKKERVYDCAPQLNYDVFVNGTFEEQLREYVAGLRPAAPHLAGLGASPQQIEEFEQMLADITERIIAEQLDQTRH